MQDCLFCKIIAGDIPSQKVYEDDEVYAFHDISPKAATHVLVIPKHHVATLDDVSTAQEIGALMMKVRFIANDILHLDSGYRLITNVREGGGQVVFHLHVHILGGESLPF